MLFQALKVNNCQTRLTYKAKLSFRADREIRAFGDKNELSRFTSNVSTTEGTERNIIYRRKGKFSGKEQENAENSLTKEN